MAAFTLIWSMLASLVVGAGIETHPSGRSSGGVGVLDVRIPANRGDDNYYVTDVDFQGQTFPVLFDTGSADLFVATTECSTANVTSGCYGMGPLFEIQNDTNVVPDQTFYTLVGQGYVAGDVGLLDISLGGVTAQDLAIGLATSAVQNEFQNGSFDGIIGLNMISLSRLNYSYGYLPPFDKLVHDGSVAKPLFSVGQLPRYGDPDSPKVGKVTLGGIEEGVIGEGRQITYSETVDTQDYNLPGSPFVPQGWTIVLQGLRVNGIQVNLSQSSVNPNGSYLSMFDSGTSDLAVRPTEMQSIADLFTGTVVFTNYHDIYFDCSVPQLVELKYNDQWIPIDPLDLIDVGVHSTSANGTELCRAAIGPWQRTFADSIIGAPWFRSAFTVFDYVTMDLYAVQPRVGVAPLVDADSAMARYASVYKSRL